MKHGMRAAAGASLRLLLLHSSRTSYDSETSHDTHICAILSIRVLSRALRLVVNMSSQHGFQNNLLPGHPLAWVKSVMMQLPLLFYTHTTCSSLSPHCTMHNRFDETCRCDCHWRRCNVSTRLLCLGMLSCLLLVRYLQRLALVAHLDHFESVSVRINEHSSLPEVHALGVPEACSSTA
jgi:hypothetical protein